MSRRPSAFAAILATIVVIAALSPLIAVVPVVDSHFPDLFHRMLVLPYIAEPGILMARVLCGDTWNRATLPIAVIGSWIFYYAFFRLFMWLLGRRRPNGVRT